MDARLLMHATAQDARYHRRWRLEPGSNTFMSDHQKARELERLRSLELIEQLNKEESASIARMKAQAAARGGLQSGGTLTELTRIRAEKMERLIDGSLAIRKEIAKDVPALATDESLSQRLSELTGSLGSAFTGLLEHDAPWLSQNPQLANAIRQRNDQEAAQLTSRAQRRMEIIKREVALNLDKKAPPSVGTSINTGGGPAIVNLGTIYGHVQQVIGNVSEGGDEHLAELLQRLAKAINDAEALGSERGAYLEKVEFIAKQATEPTKDRQTNVVKGLFAGLRARLGDAAHLAHILELVGPALARHFGLIWPF